MSATLDADVNIGGAPALRLSDEEQRRYRVHVPVATEFLDMSIDESAMYVAPLPIVSGSEDREGERSDPDGLIDTAFRRNPLVFLNHSHMVDPMLPPIGTCETPDRQYDLHRTENGWSGGTRFSQSTALAEQSFALVCEGLLRGRSIGALDHDLEYYDPVAPGMAMDDEGRIRAVRRVSVIHTAYELVEFSWVWLPCNRDMVIALKSVLSRNSIQGQRLDSGLRMVIKSLNLQEPVSSAAHSNGQFHKQFDRIFQSQEKSMTERLVGVRFATKNFTIDQAKSFLKDSEDFRETELRTETINGHTYLRSDQKAFRGKALSATDPRCPGLELLFVRSSQLADAADPEKPDQQAVQDIIASVAGGTDATMRSTDPASQSADQASATVVPEDIAAGSIVVDADDDDDTVTGPSGAMYLAKFIKAANELLEESDAALDEQEPELVTKCGDFLGKVREAVREAKSVHAERYGTTDEEATDDEDAPEKEMDPAQAQVVKRMRADVFYGRRHRVSAQVGAAIRAIERQLRAKQTEKALRTVRAVTKGLVDKPDKPAKVTRRDLLLAELGQLLSED